ncbi:MAG: undecaprenyl/decaprenyl-phosphate alpha-N-acetylglucosaminyl 1-phosphate transferase [Cyclobacteriaceae bacterium]
MFLFLAVATAFFITFILLPLIIKVSRSIDILDTPDVRKVHSVGTPSLGGIAIFIGFMLAMGISVSLAELAQLKFFLAGIILIFILGIRDDVSSLQAKHKLAIQILSALLVVYFSGISLEGLYGLFGVTNLPLGVSEALTVFMIVALTNSFNLIDGIDGLAGSLGVIVLSLFGWVFLESSQMTLAVICFSVSGSLIAFLFFNWYPSKVFMGDTGSMLLGFISSVLSILIINTTQGANLSGGINIEAPVALAVATLIIPIYDTFRVFIIRFSKGQSPLVPDRNHIHHGLLEIGMSHAQATLILSALNLSVIVFSLLLNDVLDGGILILVQVLIVTSFGVVIDLLGKRKKHLSISSKVHAEKSLYISKSA